MKKIKMQNSSQETLEEVFERFLAASAARGVKVKTLSTYKQHFKAISKRLNPEIPIHLLTKKDLESMISRMRTEGLSDTTISSYTRTLKVFFSWSSSENITSIDMSIYKAAETFKETYSDEELLLLLKRPSASCSFCEYRNWTIVNFLMNSGCRASTIRNIQNQDVDLSHHQITLRHTKNGKIQIIPLCSTMVNILSEYMQIRKGNKDDYLFCNECGEVLSENGLSQAIRRYNRARGVQKTSIHSFRHSFARKYLIDCGGNAFTLQKLMGHSTLNMTKHYCKIFDADIAKDYDSFSPLAQIQKPKERITKK